MIHYRGYKIYSGVQKWHVANKTRCVASGFKTLPEAKTRVDELKKEKS
jgi:hypothetical protein